MNAFIAFIICWCILISCIFSPLEILAGGHESSCYLPATSNKPLP